MYNKIKEYHVNLQDKPLLFTSRRFLKGFYFQEIHVLVIIKLFSFVRLLKGIIVSKPFINEVKKLQKLIILFILVYF